MSFLRVWPWKLRPSPSGGPSFALKTLLARPRLDQRAVDREVLVGHERLRPARRRAGRSCRAMSCVQQPVAILREHRRRPDRLVHRQADEPAEQKVVVELLHQQPLAANRVEDLQQQRPQQPLRRNRRPARSSRTAGRTRATCRAAPHRPARGSARSGWSCGTRCSGGHVAEHRVGLAVVSSHAPMVVRGSRACRSRLHCVFQQAPRARVPDFEGGAGNQTTGDATRHGALNGGVFHIFTAASATRCPGATGSTPSRSSGRNLP